MPGPCGILLVDKPPGLTSRQTAEAVGRPLGPPPPRRRRSGERRFRVGHAGTLDPLATGLLIVLVGSGTRLAPFLQGLDKRYLATVRFGTETDTHDRDGEVTATAPVPAAATGLESALAKLRAADRQVPPVISSLKRAGRSLHRLARAGREVAEPSARPVRIERLAATALRWGVLPPAISSPQLTAPDGLLYEVDLDIVCGSGTYVRALARDLGAALGTRGHVHELRRLAVGPFTVQEAATVAALEREGQAAKRLLPLAAALPHVPAFELSLAQADQVRHGGQPQADWLSEPVPAQFRLLTKGGRLAAVGRRDPLSGQPVIAVVFPDEIAAAAENDPCG